MSRYDLTDFEWRVIERPQLSCLESLVFEALAIAVARVPASSPTTAAAIPDLQGPGLRRRKLPVVHRCRCDQMERVADDPVNPLPGGNWLGRSFVQPDDPILVYEIF